MKDLIIICNYSPDPKRKEILLSLLLKLQNLRERFDLMISTHSKLDIVFQELVDLIYYDKKNIILDDFNHTPLFYFENENFRIISSKVYSETTHLTIMRLIDPTWNFAKFMNYEKIHFIEYDLNFDSDNIFYEVSKILENTDSVMFKTEGGFPLGCYFATKKKNTFNIFDPKKLLNELNNDPNRMTEKIIEKRLDENIHFLSSNLISLQPSVVDNHGNDKIKWLIPIYCELQNRIFFFTFNEFDKICKIKIKLNDQLVHEFDSGEFNVWNLFDFTDIYGEKKIEVYVDDILEKTIHINEKNIDDFKKNNYITYLQ
jgi:hypothetical protein